MDAARQGISARMLRRPVVLRSSIEHLCYVKRQVLSAAFLLVLLLGRHCEEKRQGKYLIPEKSLVNVVRKFISVSELTHTWLHRLLTRAARGQHVESERHVLARSVTQAHVIDKASYSVFWPLV